MHAVRVAGNNSTASNHYSHYCYFCIVGNIFTVFFLSDKLSCSRVHTLLFVAFDLEENQPFCPANCSCQGFLCGSNYFVQNLTRYLNSTGVGFQGAFVLDTILNHNTTPNSQKFPNSLQPLFPTLYKKVSDNQFKGDFLAVIGRVVDDLKLINAVTDAFQSDGK